MTKEMNHTFYLINRQRTVNNDEKHMKSGNIFQS